MIPAHFETVVTTPIYPTGFYRKDCRLCHGTKLETFLDFGMHPHSDGFVRGEQLTEPEPFFPLATELCHNCGQVQINYVVNPAYLFGEDYIYDSSVTTTSQKHFMTMAKEIVDTYKLPPASLAVDIGSNVGLLLSGFAAVGLNVQGVDPTPKMTAIAIKNGIETLTEEFSPEIAMHIVAQKGKAAVITATNVFAHIDDLDAVMKGVDALLDEKGIFVIEAPYLADLLDHLEYDTIYHQHLSYFSVTPLDKFFHRFGMQIIDVERIDYHGGSIRVFVARNGARPVTGVPATMMKEEALQKLHSIERMHRFAADVERQRAALTKMLVEYKTGGASIVGVGAPAKGSTMLNYCGITGALLDYVTEKNQLKIGRFTPGTHIPIVADETLMKTQPTYALILSWNFADEIMKNLHAYKEKGGRFILPIPSPHLL